AAGVRKERQGLAVHRAFDRGNLGDVLHENPGDVTDPRLRGVPGDGGPVGRDGGFRGEEEAERGGGEPGPGHSGRCWRRNCSISATSSAAGGRSLGPPGAAGAGSSVSRDSSFLT